MTDASGSPGGSDRSLPEKVYDYLREGIIEGDLPPGMRLLEREISERLGVSRIPIREALPQLEAEGFVQTMPRRGSIVTQLSLRDVDELFDVRASLEVLAARLAAHRADERTSAELGRALERADVATANGAEREIAAANAGFHEVILRMTGNRLLQAMAAPINGRVRWLFRLTSDRDPRMMCEEHHELHGAICGGHADLAASLAFVHVERGRQPSLELLAGVLPPDRPS